MYQILFDSTVNLCERFAGFDPIKIRQYPAHEVILLLVRLIDYNKRHKKDVVKNNGEPQKIRKPAGDTWF